MPSYQIPAYMLTKNATADANAQTAKSIPTALLFEKEEIKSIAREESIWYLCSLIHSTVHQRQQLASEPSSSSSSSTTPSDPLSSDEVFRAARDILIRPLLTGRSKRAPDHLSGSSLNGVPWGSGLGLISRGLITAALEAVNGCCIDSWEVEEAGESENGH
ncbi:hypothetical protein DL93DRAFT_2084000 [Clavulina sp. PMI_390]|nr:hypothetical protein DL93DRAFT_2084000 [Clavulina sp. PMI_390]